MTEADWLGVTDVWDVEVPHLPGISYRKFFHFLGAALPVFTEADICSACREAAAIIERQADRFGNRSSLSVERSLNRLQRKGRPPDCRVHGMVRYAGRCATGWLMIDECLNKIIEEWVFPAGWKYGDRRRSGTVASLSVLRDVFGNPFRPPTIDPTWLTWQGGIVVALARAVYDDRSFDLLPVLADALEDAGCSEAAILDHLRAPASHVRGCWAVDLLLGKSKNDRSYSTAGDPS